MFKCNNIDICLYVWMYTYVYIYLYISWKRFQITKKNEGYDTASTAARSIHASCRKWQHSFFSSFPPKKYPPPPQNKRRFRVPAFNKIVPLVLKTANIGTSYRWNVVLTFRAISHVLDCYWVRSTIIILTSSPPRIPPDLSSLASFFRFSFHVRNRTNH